MSDYQKDADHIMQIAMPLDETRDAIAAAIEYRVKRERERMKKRAIQAIHGVEFRLDAGRGGSLEQAVNNAADECLLAMSDAVIEALK